MISIQTIAILSVAFLCMVIAVMCYFKIRHLHNRFDYFDTYIENLEAKINNMPMRNEFKKFEDSWKWGDRISIKSFEEVNRKLDIVLTILLNKSISVSKDDDLEAILLKYAKLFARVGFYREDIYKLCVLMYHYMEGKYPSGLWEKMKPIFKKYRVKSRHWPIDVEWRDE